METPAVVSLRPRFVWGEGVLPGICTAAGGALVRRLRHGGWKGYALSEILANCPSINATPSSYPYMLSPSDSPANTVLFLASSLLGTQSKMSFLPRREIFLLQRDRCLSK